MKKPTLNEIADAAGVSLTTVSMTLAGKGRISTEVRERVFAAAKKIGYVRKKDFSLQNEKEVRVGILHLLDATWAPTYFFIHPILMALEAELKAQGFIPVLVPIYTTTTDDEILLRLTASGTRALFSIHYGNETFFSIIENRGLPVVVINNNSFKNRFYAVCVDDFQGAYEGAMHLIEKGHTAIAYLEYKRPDMPTLITNRFVGFKKALDEHSISFPISRMISIEPADFNEMEINLRTLFAGRNRPTAIFAHDDRFAAAAIAVLASMGLHVPEDVSIIAPGDVLDYSEPFLPKITTMRINTQLMGKLSAEMMVARLRNMPSESHVINIKQQLVERGSCRKL